MQGGFTESEHSASFVNERTPSCVFFCHPFPFYCGKFQRRHATNFLVKRLLRAKFVAEISHTLIQAHFRNFAREKASRHRNYDLTSSQLEMECEKGAKIQEDRPFNILSKFNLLRD